MTSRGSLVVLLHGVRASGRDLAPLAGELGKSLPQALLVAPDALPLSDDGAGRQWFSVANITHVDRPQRVAAARTDFDAVLAERLDHVGLADQLDRVALVGFSQGAIMALDAMATGRWPVAAVVAFSGRLASPGPLTPAPGARALLVHGAADPVIPMQETLDAAARLREAGVSVECHIEPGVGHSIPPAGVALAGAFLA
ncbi:MAG: dienelactone hydrolase family protein, partial [Hyphomicrobiales bacterium]|nr:dienelactone hydrolase family protein [Hyphomicrobiales bacterium]